MVYNHDIASQHGSWQADKYKLYTINTLLNQFRTEFIGRFWIVCTWKGLGGFGRSLHMFTYLMKQKCLTILMGMLYGATYCVIIGVFSMTSAFRFLHKCL